MSNFGGKLFSVSASIIPNLAAGVYCHTSHVLCDISHKLNAPLTYLYSSCGILRAPAQASDAFFLQPGAAE